MGEAAAVTATVQAGLNPYVGPRAFQPGETLYGRDREVLELLDLVLAERIVLLHSPSGAGKTSLIQAALIPRLKEEGFEVLPVIRVSLEPPVGTDTEEGRNRYVLSTLLSLEQDVPTDKQFDVADLARMSLDDYLSQRPAEADNRVLIFDQFEEVLLNPADQAEKREFFDQLGAALRRRDRWALFAMREDYVAALDPYLRTLPTRARTKFRLDFLTQQAASQAVQRPAEQAGITFSEGAVTKLVDDLSQVLVPQPDGSSEPQPGPYVEPVQLQVVCLRLWDRLEPEQKEIGESDIESAGDVDNALSMYYAQQVADVARRTGVSERSIREWFDSQLIVEQRFRGQAREGPQDSIDDVQPALLLLEDAHLIRAEQRRGTTWYELAHDRLVTPVLTDNARWRQEHLHAFQRQAEIWDDEDRPEGLLFRGRELAEAETWAAEHGDELTRLDREFLDACRRARARKRLYTRILVGVAAAVVILAGVAVYFAVRVRPRSTRFCLGRAVGDGAGEPGSRSAPEHPASPPRLQEAPRWDDRGNPRLPVPGGGHVTDPGDAARPCRRSSQVERSRPESGCDQSRHHSRRGSGAGLGSLHSAGALHPAGRRRGGHAGGVRGPGTDCRHQRRRRPNLGCGIAQAGAGRRPRRRST